MTEADSVLPSASAAIEALSPLERLMTLDARKQRAFLALFAGACREWITRSDTDAMPMTGKAECEWIRPWREFWQIELPRLGLITFSEGDPFPTPGAIFDSATTITIGVTGDGYKARDDWWSAWKRRVEKLEREDAEAGEA